VIVDRAPQTVESLETEIGRLVTERQALRDRCASPDELEDNRRRLAAAQSELSRLYIQRHLTRPAFA